MSQNEPDSRDALYITIIAESGKCIRWSLVIGMLCLFFWKGADAFIAYSSIPRPWYELLLNPILPSGLWSGPLLYIYNRFRKHIRDHADRLADLEKSCDPNRSSSGVNKDGTHEFD